MDDQHPVKLITREELAHGLRESKTPGYELILGAVGGLVQQAIDARTHAQGFDWPAGVEAALIGAALLWAGRIVLNVWRAPRMIAAEDRKALESAYAELQKKYEDARHEIGTLDEKDKRTRDLLSIAHWVAGSLVREGTKDRFPTMSALDEWSCRVEDFKRSMLDLQVYNLTDAERADIAAAYRTFPRMDPELHIDADHARRWEHLNALCGVLNNLLHKYELKNKSSR